MGVLSETQNNINEDDNVNEKDALQQNGNKENKPKLTFSEGITNVFQNVTVEPSLWLFLVGALITMITSQNLSLEKACRVNLAYSDEICNSLKMQQVDTQNEYEKETQKLLGKALTWKTYLTATLPCVMALFAGSFSDKTGYRKLFLIFPIAGQLLISVNNMLHVYFFYQIRLEYLVLTESIIEGLSGGWCMAFLTAFSYIGTITTEETRTFRMGIVNFCITVAFPIGLGTSGILLNKTGYYGCYGLIATMHSLNLIYTTFVLKDPVRTIEQKKHDGKGVCHYFRVFFDLANVKDAFSVVLKDAPNKRKLRLCILLVVVTFIFGPILGEAAVLYMSTRYRFNWTEVDFSIFQAYNFVLHTVGAVFSIVVFCKYLKWHDSLLGIISTASKIAGSFVYCFAPTAKVFFLAPLVEILNSTSLLALKSMISKQVEPNELGKVNSVLGMVENLMPLVYVPMYINTYTATMEVLPGAVFLLGASMSLPAFIALCWFFYDSKKEAKRLKREAIE